MVFWIIKFLLSISYLIYVDFDQFKNDTENNISKINSKLKDLSNASLQNTRGALPKSLDMTKNKI